MSNQQIVRIVQSADPGAEAIGLKKYGMSKVPNTMHIVQAKLDSENRWITGIDEHSQRLRQITDDTERNAKKKKLKELRENLQNQLGIPDLSATSPYWETFFIDLASITMLDVTNAKHRLYYQVIKANNYVIPDSMSKDTPENWDTKFMAFNPDFESGVLNKTRKLTDLAIININKLEDDYDRLQPIARLCIGSTIDYKLSPSVLFERLRSWLDVNPKENTKLFNHYFDMDIEDLLAIRDVREAIRFGVITYRDNKYSRGAITLGRTEDEVLKELSSNELVGEFDSIRKEVKNKIAITKTV